MLKKPLSRKNISIQPFAMKVKLLDVDVQTGGAVSTAAAEALWIATAGMPLA